MSILVDQDKSEQNSSYRQIMKATSLFGSVQIFQIIISIIRSKFIAILLGPAGMGISGLLTSSTGFISALTNFGLGTSSIKEISSANASGNQTKIAIVTTVLNRLVWLTGIIGALVTIVLSPWLSDITFGSRSYTFSFILISVTLLINQLTIGKLAVLQGMRKWQYLSKASLIGSVFGLIFTIPLYFWFRIDGIVPAIILSSVISLYFSWIFSKKTKIEQVKVSRIRTYAEGKSMLTMGFIISISGLINIGSSYILRIFISQVGGINEVGLYNAGFTIINSYVGLVFSAMATDYYPRLSAIAQDNNKINVAINQQAEIMLLILGPIINIFLVFIRYLVILFYSKEFVAVDPMIHWAALGMLFRGASWSISFVFLAKGDAKLFFWNELGANVYILIANILGYHFYRLSGLGISFIVGYVLYLIQVFITSKIMYTFFFQKSFIRIFIIQLFIAIICFSLVKVFINTSSAYYYGSVAIVISMVYSIYELNKKLGLKAIVQSFINKVNFK